MSGSIVGGDDYKYVSGERKRRRFSNNKHSIKNMVEKFLKK
jgi:hypothetical protein